MPAFGIDQPGNGVKGRCLARSVRPQQGHHFALLHFKRHVADYHALLIAFAQRLDLQAGVLVRQMQAGFDNGH